MPSKEPCYDYEAMLADPGIKRWLRNIRRGSPITADVAMRRLGKACNVLGTNPQDMLQKARENLREFQDSLEDMVAKLEDEKKAPQYIAGILKHMRSWLRYNDILLPRKIKISNLTSTPTIENEGVPSKEELAAILRSADKRTRVAISLIAFSDLRPETLGNHDGSDGLKLSDLPEMHIQDGRVSFDKNPTMIMVRAPLSKARHKYFTFLSHEGCKYLKEYLEERTRDGDKVAPESPLVGHERFERQTKLFMLTRKISGLIRDAMRGAGIQSRPYVLRAYAETQFIIAESKRLISHPYLQFMAGHKGDIEATYSTNKGRLPPEMIEEMRQSYTRSISFLSSEEGADALRVRGMKDTAIIMGADPKEVDKADELGTPEEKLRYLADLLKQPKAMEEYVELLKRRQEQVKREVETENSHNGGDGETLQNDEGVDAALVDRTNEIEILRLRREGYKIDYNDVNGKIMMVRQ